MIKQVHKQGNTIRYFLL